VGTSLVDVALAHVLSVTTLKGESIIVSDKLGYYLTFGKKVVESSQKNVCLKTVRFDFSVG